MMSRPCDLTDVLADEMILPEYFSSNPTYPAIYPEHFTFDNAIPVVHNGTLVVHNGTPVVHNRTPVVHNRAFAVNCEYLSLHPACHAVSRALNINRNKSFLLKCHE
jgi:hypothetical protein